MTIDIPTLAIFLSLTNLMQVIALSVQYAMNRKQPGVLYWLVGTAVIAVGFLLNYLREAPVFGTWAIFLNNVFFVAGLSCLYAGVLRYFGKRENRRALLLFSAIFLGMIFFFTFAYDNLAARRVLISTALAVLSLLTARALWMYKTRSVTLSANFLAVVFFGYGIFFIMRALSPFFAGPVGNIFSATATQVATYVVVLCVSTLWTFGFVLLVNQRLSQESLEAQEQLELMFNTEPDATILSRMRDGMMVRVNDGFTALTGYSRAETVGKSTLAVNIWKNPEERQKLVAALSENGYRDNLEAVFQRKDGSELYGLVSAKMLTLNGEPHIISVTRDISEQKRAEEALRESETKHRVLFQNSPDAYLIAADGIFVDCNRATEIMLRGDRAQIVGKTPDALSPEFQPDGQKSSDAAAEKIRIAFELGSTSFEWMHRRFDGTDFWVEVSIAGITLENKPALFTTWRDITERKRSEDLIRARLDLMQYANEHALPEVLQKTLDVASELTDSPIGFYHFVESDGNTLSLQAWSTRTLAEFCHAQGAGMHYPLDQAGVWADCVKSKTPVIHNDYASLPNRKGLPEGHAQVVRELVAPILRGEQVVGILGVGNKARDYDTSDVDLIQYFADVAWEIAERKRAEEALRASQEQINQLLQTTDQGIYGIDTGGNCTFINRSGLQILGYQLDECLGKEMHALMHHSHADGSPYAAQDCPIFRAKETGVGSRVESEVFWRKDGTAFPVEYSSYPIFENGVIRGAVVTFFDITARKRAQEALRESEEKFHQMADLLPQIIFESDARGNLTFVNRQAYQAFGYPEDFSIVGTPSLTFHVPEERQRVMDSIRARMMGQPFENHEYNMLRQDGTTFPALVYSTPIIKDEKPIGLRGLIIDITERKRMEEALRETNAYLENLINYANAPIIVWDPHYRITRFNHAFETLTGRAEAEVLGQSLELLFPSELAENSMKLIRQTTSGERWETVEIKILHRDGTVRTVLWNSATLFAADGTTPIATIAQGQEITKRKRMEQELRETNAYLENLINYANAPIIVWDPQFHITRFNHAFETLTGRAEAEVLGQSLELLFPRELAEASMKLIRKTLHGEHWETVEIKILHRDGTVRTVLWNSATLFAADGTTPIATIAQGQDITERKRLEEELQEQATTDVLTGAFNRRRFIELAAYELKRAARLEIPSALAIIDIDHFKQVNDTYGHAAGDQALQTFTRICKENIREIDVFARFGGDEFAMLLPGTDGKQAYQIVERIRAAISAKPTILNGKPVPLTISAGIASMHNGIALDELMAHADHALYVSKTHGRNYVALDGVEVDNAPNGKKSARANP